jgi:hypothetical protein
MVQFEKSPYLILLQEDHVSTNIWPKVYKKFKHHIITCLIGLNFLFFDSVSDKELMAMWQVYYTKYI